MPVSPAAQALFAAANSKETPSSDLHRRALTASWRNRHSQAAQYPYTTKCDTVLHVKQVQRGEVEETYGTGATVWPAAVVLSKYVEKMTPTFDTVVDLGSGTGLTSLVAAVKWKQAQIICTDGNNQVVDLMKSNVALHPGLQSRIQCLYYWWSQESPTWMPTGPILVLVADCVLPKLYPIEPLLQALSVLLEHDESQALLSYEYRYYPEYDPETKFRELCSQYGLKVDTIPYSEQDPVYQADDIHLWRVYKG